MDERPILDKNLSSLEFKEFYYLKKELIEFCKFENLKSSGNKEQLEKRIIYYLKTGKKLNETSSVCVAGKKLNETSSACGVDKHLNKISLNSKLGKNFTCSQDVRKFFKKEIGNNFTFKVPFLKWLKSHPDNTYSDAINEFYKIQSELKSGKTKIDKQFQYNSYIRDFFKNNKGKSLNDAIKCWKFKKSLKGHNKYENSDLIVLA